MSDQRVELPGSAPSTRDEPGAQPRWSSPADPNQKVSVTITLRRKRNSATAALEEQLLSGHFRAVPREQAAEELAADPRDIAAVRFFLEQNGLTVTDENAAARTLKVDGTAQQMAQAFSAQLAWFEDASGNRHLSYQGPLSIPQSLEGVITSVIGLDQSPIAKRQEGGV